MPIIAHRMMNRMEGVGHGAHAFTKGKQGFVGAKTGTKINYHCQQSNGRTGKAEIPQLPTTSKVIP